MVMLHCNHCKLNLQTVHTLLPDSVNMFFDGTSVFRHKAFKKNIYVLAVYSSVKQSGQIKKEMSPE